MAGLISKSSAFSSFVVTEDSQFTASIMWAYIKLGDDKRAKKCAEEKCYQNGIEYHLVRSLCDIYHGDVESCDRSFARAQEFFDAAKLTRFENHLTLAEAYHVRSLISHHSGASGAALVEALISCELLTKLVTAVFDKEESHPLDGGNPPRVIRLYFDCLNHLGWLLMLRGSAKEAEYFFRRGFELSERFRLLYVSAIFVSRLVDLFQRQWREKDAQKMMDVLVKFQETINFDANMREQAWFKWQEGDAMFRNKDYARARLLYQQADCVLKNFSSNIVQDIRACVRSKQALATFLEGAQEDYDVGTPIEFLPFSEEKIEEVATETVLESRSDPRCAIKAFTYRSSNQDAKGSDFSEGALRLQKAREIMFLCGTAQSFYQASTALSAHLLNDQALGHLLTSVLSTSHALTSRREMMIAIRNKLGIDTSSRNFSWPTGDYDLDQPDDPRLTFWKHLYEQYSSEGHLDPEESHLFYCKNLPANWVVLAISVDDSSLYITRISRFHCVSIAAPVEGLCRFDFDLNSIISESDEIARSGASCQTKQQKLDWWQRRESLDNRLRLLLKELELSTFGWLRGILRTTVDESLKKKLGAIINRVLLARKSRVSKRGLDDIWPLIASGLSASDGKDIETFSRLLLKHQGFASIPPTTLQKLVQKIADILQSREDANIEEDQGHIIFIPDNRLQHFPWESIPSLRQQSVSRLPSLSMLRDRLELMVRPDSLGFGSKSGLISADAESVSYVLNPNKDLTATEERLVPFLKSPEWNGVRAKKPDEATLLDMLSRSEVYLYFGHGSGESLTRPSRIRGLDRCAASLLLGCSSGRLRENGTFDPNGPIMDYLMAGAYYLLY